MSAALDLGAFDDTIVRVPTDAQWAARRAQAHAEQIASYEAWRSRYREFLVAHGAGDVAECERLVTRERALRAKR